MSTVHTNNNGGSPSFWTTSTVLQWLLALALIYTLYLAKTLLVPVTVALMLTLLLGPLVTFFRRFYVPRIVSTIVLLTLLSGPFAFLVIEIGEPMQRWAQLVPELSDELSEQVESFQSNLSDEEGEPETQETTEEDESGGFFSGLFGGSDEEAAQAEAEAAEEEEDESNPVMDRLSQGGVELSLYILSAAPTILAQMITCLVMTIFLLVFGSKLFESVITHLPQISNKKRAHHLVETIESELSRYILTVSVINFGLGGAVALALWLMGVDNAVLWGVLVALLNYAPYVGTFIGVAVLLMAGLAQYGLMLQALMPAVVYLIINSLEAQFVTPTVLGFRMRINPLILMAWLIFWAWLWGFVGVLLAVPMLVCIKLAARELEAPPYWTRVIETQG